MAYQSIFSGQGSNSQQPNQPSGGGYKSIFGGQNSPRPIAPAPQQTQTTTSAPDNSFLGNIVSGAKNALAGVASAVQKIPEFHFPAGFSPNFWLGDYAGNAINNLPALKPAVGALDTFTQGLANTPGNAAKGAVSLGYHAGKGDSNTQQVLADASDAASLPLFFLGFGESSIVKGAVETGVKAVAKGLGKDIAIGGGFGALGGFSSGRNITDPKDYLKNLLANIGIGAVTGGAIGAVTHVAIPLIKGGSDKLGAILIRNADKTPSIDHIQMAPEVAQHLVLTNGLEKEPVGKEILKESLVAQKEGTHVSITPSEKGRFGSRIGKVEVSTVEPYNSAKTTPYDTPAVIQRRAEIAQEPSTHQINTPEREAFRQKVADELYGNGAANKNKRIDIVTGLPAAGKSSVLVDPLAKEHGSLVVDADMAKEKLPEFNGGKNANVVHQESSDIVEGRLLSKAMANGDNIVLPVVGKSLEKMQALLGKLKEAGYDVHLHHNSVPPEVAASRAVQRFSDTGRFVDPHYVLHDVGLKPDQNYDILKMEKGISSYEKYSNDVPKGEAPKLIERSGRSENGQYSQNPNGTQQTTQESATPATSKESVTPETKTSKLALGVQEKAVEKNLTDSLGKLPEYKTVKMDEQAKLASDLLKTDPQNATKIAMGETEPPHGILPEAVFIAVENKALEDGAISVLKDLANSKVTIKASEAGQHIRMLAERNPDSAVAAIKDVATARAKNIEKRTGKGVDDAVKQTTQEIKKNVKPPDKYDWGKFLDSIQC